MIRNHLIFIKDSRYDVSDDLVTMWRNGIGDTITIGACYQPNVDGGFGVRLPSIVYCASRIVHLISMLNYEEENIRFVARNSLELDMRERNVSRVHHGLNCLRFEKDLK